jgi:hypothetical protein
MALWLRMLHGVDVKESIKWAISSNAGGQCDNAYDIPEPAYCDAGKDSHEQ